MLLGNWIFVSHLELKIAFMSCFPSQVAASTLKEVDSHIPNYPNVQSQLVCQLHNIALHVYSLNIVISLEKSVLSLQILIPYSHIICYKNGLTGQNVNFHIVL